MSIFAAFHKEWMEQVRSYRLLVVAIVLLFFGITSPILTKLTPELLNIIPTGGITIQMPPQTVLNAIDQYVKNMEQFGILLAILLSMSAVAQEKDKGTAAMMLVKPLSRSAFLGAKFLSLAAVFAISLAASAIASYYYTVILFERMDILHWVALNLLIYLIVLVFIAVTLFCSTLMKSQAAAGGVTLGLTILSTLLGSVLGLGKYLPGELATWGARLMRGDATPSWIALGVSLGLVGVPLLAAWLVFRRQEL